MTQQVAQLRTELNGAGQSMSRMERMRNWGNASAIAGGIVAAGAIVAPSVSNQMSYEQRLAYDGNTAFSDRIRQVVAPECSRWISLFEILFLLVEGQRNQQLKRWILYLRRVLWITIQQKNCCPYSRNIHQPLSQTQRNWLR
jgi:hypothetical protein